MQKRSTHHRETHNDDCDYDSDVGFGSSSGTSIPNTNVDAVFATLLASPRAFSRASRASCDSSSVS